MTLSDIKPPHAYTLSFDAQGGVAGHGKGVSHVELVPNDQGVLLHYTVESQIGGKLAQLGQRLIDGAAKSMAHDFFKRFDVALQEKTGASAQMSDTDQAVVALAQPHKVDGGIPRWLIIAAAAAVAVATYVMYS